MKWFNDSRISLVSAVLILTVAAGLSQAATINVGPGVGYDFDSIQAGIDAARDGDTVNVAPGTYYENVVLKSGVSLQGSGANVTVIDAGGYGDVVDAQADNVMISGFTLRNSGEFDLGHMNCGVYVCESSPVIRNNIIVNNGFGIGLWHGPNPEIRNNIITNNSSGIYIYGLDEKPSDPDIINNTIVNNKVDGITLRVMVSPIIANNIITEHVTGINLNYVTGSPVISYNNLWHNNVNYMRDNRTDDTLAGPGSISADPCFAEPGFWVDTGDPNIIAEPNDPNAVWVDGDYHLKSESGRWNPNTQTWVVDDVTSPCINAGDPNMPVGDEPFPNGVIINMGAYGGTVEASKLSSDIPMVINVNDSDNGSQVTLKQGQILAVTLESNPSTGYSWYPVEKQDSILEKFGDTLYFPSEDDDGIVGAGGWEILYFTSINIGRETLELVYRRSWEEGVEPVKTFSIDVVVN